MSETVTIDPQFTGPPDSGNGGYVCGLLASRIEGASEVSLRQPPPIGKPLELRVTDQGIALFDADALVAEAKPTELSLEVPHPPTLDQARAAAENYPGFQTHAFPTCFVCGPEREEGDGLRVFTGPVNGANLVAGPWTPHASLAGPAGTVALEFCWAAMDCPGAWAFLEPGIVVLLGTMAARIEKTIHPGEKCIVIGWSIGSERRKRFAGTAIFNEAGELAACSSQTWIEIDR